MLQHSTLQMCIAGECSSCSLFCNTWQAEGGRLLGGGSQPGIPVVLGCPLGRHAHRLLSTLCWLLAAIQCLQQEDIAQSQGCCSTWVSLGAVCLVAEGSRAVPPCLKFRRNVNITRAALSRLQHRSAWCQGHVSLCEFQAKVSVHGSWLTNLLSVCSTFVGCNAGFYRTEVQAHKSKDQDVVSKLLRHAVGMPGNAHHHDRLHSTAVERLLLVLHTAHLCLCTCLANFSLCKVIWRSLHWSL